MAKGARRTGRRRGLSRGVPRRISARRAEKTTVLILGEGRQTEPNYFRGLKDDAATEEFAITVKKGEGVSPERVVKKAVTLKEQANARGEDYDEVWCVLDVEGPTREALERAAAAAARKGITLCLSNPCFEVWLLSHYQRGGRPYEDCSAVVGELNGHWRRHYGQDYRKNDERVYDKVASLTATAIGNAEWVGEVHHRGEDKTANCNSSTEVYRLVKRLTGGSAAP